MRIGTVVSDVATGNYSSGPKLKVLSDKVKTYLHAQPKGAPAAFCSIMHNGIRGYIAYDFAVSMLRGTEVDDYEYYGPYITMQEHDAIIHNSNDTEDILDLFIAHVEAATADLQP